MRIANDHVAVITGGASGIGHGLAEVLAARGVRVVISDVREEGLAKARASLAEAGAEVTAVVADVADEASVRTLADRTMTAYGRVDLVCNNAGVVSPAAPLWEQTSRTWELMIGVKVLGVVHGVRAFAPLLIERGAGHFLNTASSGGLAPLPDRTPYTTTMHAVVGLTETLDEELKRVAPTLGATVLCPGLVDTPLGRNSEALGAIRLPPGTPASMRSMADNRGGILSPREVAEAALDAVEAGRVHVAPGGGVVERARARVAALLADIEGGDA
ncbi:SDR family NAD(P)-dependent oxidoreductase [Streptomyces sp. NBC_01016]|uniref:SDR family NAD(P)-dependent oxidoreductase n=1 Tax=Streptomyces sp. NBC_01016 TaxID=2903720 RepID=UPI00224F5909|nr:SDR family NAD(P)-dependent oxidoreductase [Streptomyces sp. NBC_01016]MCX4831266.1 SDR family NAD(P)-dependent oxidoreductase [Streptomyces sp. NBC_01016]